MNRWMAAAANRRRWTRFAVSPGRSAPDGSGAARGSVGPRGRSAAVDHSLIVFPVLLTIWLFVKYAAMHQLAVDFDHDFWVVGLRVRHGLSPYAWSRRQLAHGIGFPYPAFTALLFAPFSLLPRGLADVTFVVMSITACLGALRVLGVRDWRLYAFVLLWWPVINGWQTGNLTLLLVLGVAAAWRCRDSPVLLGVVVATIVSIKPVVWPLGVWLLATGRWRATASAIVSGLIVNLVAWSVIGFDELPRFLHLVSTQTDLMYRQGYALSALAVRMGAGRGIATALQALIALVVVAVCVRTGRRGDDRVSFTVAVALMMTAAPRVDNHYFALLIVPLAIARPSLSRIWLLPLAFWLCPATHLAVWQLTLAWVTLAALTLLLTRPAGLGPGGAHSRQRADTGMFSPSWGAKSFLQYAARWAAGVKMARNGYLTPSASARQW
jgi:hypothetical protein